MTDYKCYLCNGSKIDPNYGAFSTTRCPVCSTVQQNEKIPEHRKCWNCDGNGSVEVRDSSWGGEMFSTCYVCTGSGVNSLK